MPENDTRVDAEGASSNENAGASTPRGAPSLWGSTLAYKLVLGALVLVCVGGVAFMAYPFIQRVWFAYQSVRTALEYQQVVASSYEKTLEEEWRLAQEYNRARAYNLVHDVNTIVDPFVGDAETKRLNDEYWSLVNPMGDGMMGFLDIPKINQRLAMYHGTDEKELLRGVGHIQGTSLPVGGKGSHCVLSGHRGMAGAKIFTDLDQIEVGDAILLHVLNHNLMYEVDQITVVEPKEISAIDITPGEDLLTLVTCTPYAINTHRLLVRGHRVPYVETPMPVADLYAHLPLVVAGAVVLLLVIGLLVRRKLVTRKGPSRVTPAAGVR